MAEVARDVIGTILGEAAYGTPIDRLSDMIGIASVISNRAAATGVSPESIIAADNQFDAYGKALPAGSTAYRDLAQQAWDFVQKNGPVHRATFFAAPAKAKNLPTGLKAVQQSTGHIYFEDPQARAIATVAGYIKPNVDALGAVPAAYTPVEKPEAVGALNAALSGGVPAAAPATAASYASTAAPRGMEALAPNGLLSNPLSNYGRENLTPGVSGIIDAVSRQPFAADMGINSGYRSPTRNAKAGGARHSQHILGNAVDLDVSNLSEQEKTSMLDAAIEAGAKGVGIYSSGNSIHVDARRSPAVWSNDYNGIPVSQAPGWAQASLQGMMDAGPFSVTPRTTAPTPMSRDVADLANVQRQADARQQMGQTLAEAGTSLSGPRPTDTPVAAMGDVASRMPAFEKPSMDVDRAIKSGLMSAGPYSPAEGYATATDPNASYTTAKTDRLPETPQGPSVADLASAYGQMGSGLKTAGVTLAGTPIGAPAVQPGLDAVTAVAPATMPDLQIALPAPVLGRPKTVRDYRVASAVHQPARPSFTASDIYGGEYGSGLASDGSTVSRDLNGITSVTNRFGATTAMTPGGKQSAYGGDPLSGTGGSSSLFGGGGFDGISPRTKGIAVGTAVGAAVGGVPGALVGGWLGSKLSRPTSLRSVIDNPMMGAAGIPSRLGDFPDAPSRVGGLGGFGGFLGGLFGGGNTTGKAGTSSSSGSRSSSGSKAGGKSFGGVRSGRLD